jgi:cobalt-zinc-cadmium efflux system membrane fusion protein
MIRRAAVLLLALPLALSGCDDLFGRGKAEKGKAARAEHGHEHGGGITLTRFTERTELFVEFPPLAVGQESAFAAHLTRLSDFRAVAEGRLTVRLAGGGQPDESFEAVAPSVPGIFRPVAKPVHAGTRQLRFELQSAGLNDVHDVGEVTVHPSAEAAKAAAPPEEKAPEGLISFLKEQQWKVDFATAPAQSRTLRASVPAVAVINGRPDGQSFVAAPTAGHVLAETTFPRIGQAVTKGQVIVSLVPRLGGEQDMAGIRADLAKATAEYDLAVAERRRLEPLLRDGAIPTRRVDEARNRETVARASLDSARARLAATSGGSASAGSGVAIPAPIDGTIAKVSAGSGQYVEAGANLFQVVNLDRLWLEAAVSEADLLQLEAPDGAWFKVDGRAEPFTISSENGRLIAVGGVVDPVKRTIPVIFEFDNPGRALRVGMFVSAQVWTGATATGAAVPASAILDDAGQDVVFVMVEGESFERRIVRTGIRDAGMVQIIEGLSEGDRVVTRGAYLVRLAASRPTEAGHGHAH